MVEQIDQKRTLKLGAILDIQDYSKQGIVNKALTPTSYSENAKNIEELLIDNGFKLNIINTAKFNDKQLSGVLDNQIKEYMSLAQYAEYLNCQVFVFIYMRGIGVLVKEKNTDKPVLEFVDNRGVRIPIQQIAE